MLRSYKGSTYTLGASSTIDYCVKEGGGGNDADKNSERSRKETVCNKNGMMEEDEGASNYALFFFFFRNTIIYPYWIFTSHFECCFNFNCFFSISHSLHFLYLSLIHI